jgi:hypothetical protein
MQVCVLAHIKSMIWKTWVEMCISFKVRTPWGLSMLYINFSMTCKTKARAPLYPGPSFNDFPWTDEWKWGGDALLCTKKSHNAGHGTKKIPNFFLCDPCLVWVSILGFHHLRHQVEHEISVKIAGRKIKIEIYTYSNSHGFLDAIKIIFDVNYWIEYAVQFVLSWTGWYIFISWESWSWTLNLVRLHFDVNGVRKLMKLLLQ